MYPINVFKTQPHAEGALRRYVTTHTRAKVPGVAPIQTETGIAVVQRSYPKRVSPFYRGHRTSPPRRKVTSARRGIYGLKDIRASAPRRISSSRVRTLRDVNQEYTLMESTAVSPQYEGRGRRLGGPTQGRSRLLY